MVDALTWILFLWILMSFPIAFLLGRALGRRTPTPQPDEGGRLRVRVRM